jgi:CxxC motif-containing protein (DUF1111 family)
VGLIALVLAACGSGDAPVAGEPGDPLPGLREPEMEDFRAGAALFNRVFSPEEGVGPLFNENQCSACHTSPAPGGTTGFERVVKATRFEAPGTCDLLAHEGGENVRTQSTPGLRALGIERERIPPSATEIGRFTTPFLFGLGLVEAIPDETILAREDPDDADGDGISGRAGRTADGRLGRFGRKAELATIPEFNDTALGFEMGLTTPSRPEEVGLDGQPIPPGADPAPDPEVDERSTELLAAFVRFLAPPRPSPARSPAHGDTLAAGAGLFEAIGCADCHVPAMRTGRSAIPAMDRKTVALYSDLLLHDLGPGLAGVCGVGATPSETRTEMLMGLGHRDIFLHDGRATTLEDAILAHGGEAQHARDAFAALPWLRQQYVIWFLESL